MAAAAIPVAALVGGTSVAGGVLQGRAQRRAQRRSIQAQERAQRDATSRAAAELRRQEQEQRAINRRRPNVQGLLSREREAASTGPGATMLTGASGVGRQRLTLGRASALGGS